MILRPSTPSRSHLRSAHASLVRALAHIRTSREKARELMEEHFDLVEDGSGDEEEEVGAGSGMDSGDDDDGGDDIHAEGTGKRSKAPSKGVPRMYSAKGDEHVTAFRNQESLQNIPTLPASDWSAVSSRSFQTRFRIRIPLRRRNVCGRLYNKHTGGVYGTERERKPSCGEEGKRRLPLSSVRALVTDLTPHTSAGRAPSQACVQRVCLFWPLPDLPSAETIWVWGLLFSGEAGDDAGAAVGNCGHQKTRLSSIRLTLRCDSLPLPPSIPTIPSIPTSPTSPSISPNRGRSKGERRQHKRSGSDSRLTSLHLSFARATRESKDNTVVQDQRRRYSPPKQTAYP
eukprot:1192402-Prorocentrum_minimum.AAC.3